jgi:hypothetical protein
MKSLQSLRHIIWMYIRNPFFLMLTVMYVLGAIISKWMFYHGHNIVGNDICTLIFIVTIWLACIIGIIVKRQMASHRASLWPGYRKMHIFAIFFWYAVFVLIVYIWEKGLRLDIAYTDHGFVGIYLASLFAAILITYLGYLSIGRILIYAYLLTLFVSSRSATIVFFINDHSAVNYFFISAIILLLALFVYRLRTLKEDMFEYHALLSWPPQAFIRNQMKTDSKLQLWLRRRCPAWTAPRPLGHIPAYQSLMSFESRLRHWLFFEENEFRQIGSFLMFFTPVYLTIICLFDKTHEFFMIPYNSFLLLTVGPILLLISSNYKKMPYWKYELLRPVQRRDYILERGFGLLGSLELFWLLLSLFVVVFPSLMLNPSALGTWRFWLYLAFTEAFCVLIFCVLLSLACLTQARKVIFYGIPFGFFILIEFYLIPFISAGSILFHLLFCYAILWRLLPAVYRQWLEKEL